MADLSNEDRYFLQREAEARRQFREQMEARARVAAERAALTSQLSGNERLATRLQEMGFDAKTAPALHLLPLVAVAWADGFVTSREREAVLQIAAAHGIEPGTPAAMLLTSMLEERPSPTLVLGVLHVLHDLLATRGLHPRSVVEACRDVAAASGGILGWGNPVSAREQALIEQVTQKFRAKARKDMVQELELE